MFLSGVTILVGFALWAAYALRSKRVTHQASPRLLEGTLSNVPRELGCKSNADFRVIVEGRSRSLPPQVRDEIYWIGREALVNAFRHAAPRHVELEVCYSARQLRVIVRDDGCGIDTQIVRCGYEAHRGFAGMRERAAKITSQLQVWTRIGAGTEIELRVPGRVAFASDDPTASVAPASPCWCSLPCGLAPMWCVLMPLPKPRRLRWRRR
jgi:signal transduction histidine kinase